jgi:hypothetical protein
MTLDKKIYAFRSGRVCKITLLSGQTLFGQLQDSKQAKWIGNYDGIYSHVRYDHYNVDASKNEPQNSTVIDIENEETELRRVNYSDIKNIEPLPFN